MNDDIENWLCDVTRTIEGVMGQVRYDYIENFVEPVTEQVSQQVRDTVFVDLAAAFAGSRVAAEING